MSIHAVVEYPEEGFAILEDEAGKFLAFSESDEITSLTYTEPPSVAWLGPVGDWKKILAGSKQTPKFA
jgi:hypothetical protein